MAINLLDNIIAKTNSHVLELYMQVSAMFHVFFVQIVSLPIYAK